MSRLNFFGFIQIFQFILFFSPLPSSLPPRVWERWMQIWSNLRREFQCLLRRKCCREAQPTCRNCACTSQPVLHYSAHYYVLKHALHYALKNAVRPMHYSAHNVVSYPIHSLKRLAWLERFPYILASSQPFFLHSCILILLDFSLHSCILILLV